MDRHRIQPHEYDELPELTDDMVARAVGTSGKPPLWPSSFGSIAGSDVTVSVDREIAERLVRATGADDLQARVNSILRDWLDRQAA